jgi:hypothetical protein
MDAKIEQKYLFGILYVCLAASLVAGMLVPSHEHAAFVWEEIPVFSAIYGFTGCVLIIAVAKALGHYWLQKEAGYYD